MSFRNSFKAISPPWLAGEVAEKLGYTAGLALDAFSDQVREGIQARMPGVGTADALPYIGADRQIDRGPSESDASYADRLSRAFDAWRRAGSPHMLLEQLQSYFIGTIDPLPTIHVVSDNSVWHEINGSREVTRYKPSPRNWVWDPSAIGAEADEPRWHRAWVIIDAAGLWTPYQYGDAGVEYGDGHTYGSTATRNEVISLRRIARKWKPKNVHLMHIIVKFDPSLFLPSNAPGYPMPDGDWDQYANRHPDAAYWAGAL